MQYVPGKVRYRFVALLIDGIITGIITAPLNWGVAIFVTSLGESGGMTGLLIQLVGGVVQMLVAFFYYAWFYKNKGATPGKMLLKLKVVDAATGKNLTYGQTFMREILGKLLSALTLMIGYIIAIFRSDKKALHDLIAKTQVLRQA